MTQADRVRARLLQLITGASDDELFKINDTLAEAGHLELDRCSKPGSPFPLFDLPLELLEHSAHYLSRREAASILTVNRLFHDVFARVVWRSISAWQIKKSEIQMSALSRYGHLVNQLIINTDGFAVANIASLVPNVMSVSIYNDKSGSSFQAGQLDLLRNLHKVDIGLYDWSKVVLDLLSDWINSDSLSGHINEIELNVINVSEWPKELVSLYSGIIDKKRMRVSLFAFRRTIPERYLVDMAPSLNHLHLAFSGCSGRYLDNIYRSSNVTFPFVTKFGLVVCCAGHKENSLLGMTPDRFPSVRTLKIDVRDNGCVHQDGSPLPIMLSRPWPSVASLKLVGYVKQGDHMYISSALPNLIVFDYASNVDSYDLAELLPKFKFLQVLTLRDEYSNPDIGQSSTIIMPIMVMNRLRSVKLRSVTLTVDMVGFIFNYCPNLMELKLGSCTLSNDVAKHTNRISKKMKSPVRHLRLKKYFQEHLDLWVEFVLKFRNLEEILVDNGCEGAEYLEVELSERFPFAIVEQYQC
ncbi:hypothetical protein GQ42DRAFT_162455 [Ramicandelaber brevisporus]|nr:hypothetical protein GQ42DRAFT_162455 [Ramicandelaber brevisporus]